MSAQDEKDVLGVAAAIREMSDDEVLAAIDPTRSLGIGDALAEAGMALRAVAEQERAAHERELRRPVYAY